MSLFYFFIAQGAFSGAILQPERYRALVFANVFSFVGADQHHARIIGKLFGVDELYQVRRARFEVVRRLARAGEEECWVRADAALLRQILLNLLDNAVKYGPEGQLIRIVVTADDVELRLTVEDEGAGVPPADRDRVWEPYVRLRQGGPGGSNNGGSGLGLAVVRDLALALGGRVWVSGAGEANGGGGGASGASFGLSLPRVRMEGWGPPPEFQSTPALAPSLHPSNAPPIQSTPSPAASK